MRRYAWALVLGAAVAAGAPASARDMFGVVKSFHGPQRVLVFDDGGRYRVGADVAVPMFRPGDRASFSVENRAGKPTITRIDMVN